MIYEVELFFKDPDYLQLDFYNMRKFNCISHRQDGDWLTFHLTSTKSFAVSLSQLNGFTVEKIT